MNLDAQLDRFARALADRPSAEEWVREAVERRFGVAEAWAIPDRLMPLVAQRLAVAQQALDGEGEIAFLTGRRALIAAALGAAFDGIALEGPQWRQDATEALPTYEAYRAASEPF